jgi:hypothetical protein
MGQDKTTQQRFVKSSSMRTYWHLQQKLINYRTYTLIAPDHVPKTVSYRFDVKHYRIQWSGLYVSFEWPSGHDSMMSPPRFLYM